MTETQQYPIVGEWHDGVKEMEFKSRIDFYIRGNVPGEEILAAEVHKPFRDVRWVEGQGYRMVNSQAFIRCSQISTRDPEIIEAAATAQLRAAATARGWNIQAEAQNA